jgi:hypothetical protein
LRYAECTLVYQIGFLEQWLAGLRQS